MTAFPTFEAFSDASKFFVDVKNDNGETEKAMIMLRKACVAISVPCANGTVAKVAFMKSNRSANYRDSRFPKKYFPAKEIKAELVRMLQDSSLAEDAWRCLQV